MCAGQTNRRWDLRAAPAAGAPKIGTVRGGAQAIVIAVADPAALSVMVAVGARVGWLPGAALRKREKTQQKGGKSHKNMGLVGATGEDLDYYDPSAKKMSLAEELKKNGGKMNAQQMMALMNKS